jgi:hypothetical protein
VAEPVAVPLRMWTAPTSGPRLDWSWAQDRIEACESYWVVTVDAGGVPSARPVWGAWVADRLLMTIGSPTIRRNVATNPRATVHLGDPLEVVVLDGDLAKQTDRAALVPFAAAYDRKYDWSTDLDDEKYGDGIYELRPRTVTAWVAAPKEESSEDMAFPLASGKWRFGLA